MIWHGSLATDFETTWFILFEPLPVSLPSSQSLSTFVSRGIYNSLFGKVSIQLFLYHSTKLLDTGPSNLSTSSTTVQWSPRSNCQFIFSAYTFHVRPAMVRRSDQTLCPQRLVKRLRLQRFLQFISWLGSAGPPQSLKLEGSAPSNTWSRLETFQRFKQPNH